MLAGSTSALALAAALAWWFYPSSAPPPPPPVKPSAAEQVAQWNAHRKGVSAWLDQMVAALPNGVVLHSYSIEESGEWRISGHARHRQLVQSLRTAFPGSRIISTQRTQSGVNFRLMGHAR